MPTDLNAIQGGVDIIHGVQVADPYRWLEDRNSYDTEHWIAGQRAHFQDYLLNLGSLQSLRRRAIDFVDVETVDQIGKVKDRYFYRRRAVSAEQPSIFVRESADHPERLLVDSTKQSPYTAIGIHRISADGGLLAYEVKEGGEHTKAIYLVDVNTGAAIPDHLARGLARGFVFRNANDGYYYCHEFADSSIASNNDHAVKLHHLGASVDDDPVLLTLPRTQSSKLVLIYEGEMLGAVHCHGQAGVAVTDLYTSTQEKHGVWRCICQNVPSPFSPFFYRGRLFSHSFHEKPNGEVIELDPTTGAPVRVVVPEWQIRLQQCAIVSNRLYVSYLVGTETLVQIWSLDGTYYGVLPLEPGHTWGLVPAHTNETNELFLHCESVTRPPTLLRYLPLTDERIVWNNRYAPPSTTFPVTRKLTYLSKDGAEVAISLVGSEDDSPLSDRPTIMTAYGGFGMTMTPQFSVFVSILLELGFLFALPEIRGGGERGRSWHEAARGRNRQVAFDDFIASAEWLCEKGFTNPQKLAIFGGSNSGLLVGASITQRPDLFRAAICIAPLLDMVRYHLFDRARVWAGEYGTAEDPDDFRALFAYSPYHQVREDTNYPAVLFVCGDKDSRCNPAHTRKMAARLGDRRAQKHAILVDHSAERGHAPTMPLSIRIDSLTNRIAFLCHELGVPMHQEKRYDTTRR